MKKAHTSLFFDGHNYAIEAALEHTKLTVSAVKKPQLTRFESQGDYGHVKTFHQIEKAFNNPEQNVVSYALSRLNEQTLQFTVSIPAIDLIDEFILRERVFEPTVEVLKKRVEQLEWEATESKKLIVELEERINNREIEHKKETEQKILALETKWNEKLVELEKRHEQKLVELEKIQVQRDQSTKQNIDELSIQFDQKLVQLEQKMNGNIEKKQQSVLEKITKEAQIVDTKLSQVKQDISRVQQTFQDQSKEHLQFHSTQLETIQSNIQIARDWTERNSPFPLSNLITLYHSEYLMKWYDGPITKWKIIYRGTNDGFKAKDFHDRCDGVGDTMTFIKTTNGSLFGGYTPIPWTSGGGAKWDPKTFLFSLRNNTRTQPMKLLNNGPYSSNTYSIYCLKKSGPAFGGGCDICIANNSNVNTESLSNLGHSFTLSGYTFDTVEAQSFLAGSLYFQVSEIEVYAPV
jgi:hypothetical protein